MSFFAILCIFSDNLKLEHSLFFLAVNLLMFFENTFMSLSISSKLVISDLVAISSFFNKFKTVDKFLILKAESCFK